jgi:Ni/Co efflux regulator RcnB
MALAFETRMTRLATLVLAFSLAGSMTVSAQKEKKQQDHPQKDKPHDARVNVPRDGGVNVVFSSSQRDAVRSYYVNAYGRGNCPPGLAKKNNGCMPPGQAKKRYAVGQPLPAGIRIGDLPHDLNVRIGPQPSGYRYGIVDGDVILISLTTRQVVDIIDAFVR